jgi:hypothetical membrane protein
VWRNRSWRPPLVSHPVGSIPAWTVVSAALAPLVLVTSWLVAQVVQPDYDPVRQSISALAGGTASDRWIMTVGLYLVGACQLLTAAGLSTGPSRARLILAVGGLTGLGVAVFPQPAHGSAATHLIFATLSVSLLAVWPATLCSPGSRSHPLRTRPSLLVTAAFVGLLAWLYVAGHGIGGLGIAERVDTAVECSWPLVIVLAIRRGSVGRRQSLSAAGWMWSLDAMQGQRDGEWPADL